VRFEHYEQHPDYAGEVDHEELLTRLVSEFPDGWALSCSVPSLPALLRLLGGEPVRILAWCKSFAAWKRHVYPAHAWEPILLWGGRNLSGARQTPRDYLVAPMTLRQGVAGAKPLEFCYWLFDCLGCLPGDELEDLYPGSGAVAHAWASWCAQAPLAYPSEPATEALFDA
jgi:hypothetical protein